MIALTDSELHERPTLSGWHANFAAGIWVMALSIALPIRLRGRLYGTRAGRRMWRDESVLAGRLD